MSIQKDSFELFRVLGALCEPPHPSHVPMASVLGLPKEPSEADFTELFLFQLYPYASIYLGPEGMLGGEAGDKIAGFWRALNLTPPTESDHLTVLLGLYASIGDLELAEKDEAVKLMRRQARHVLLKEYLLSWVPAYAQKVSELAPPYYAEWARILKGALLEEAKELDLNQPPDILAQAPGLPSATEQPKAFVDGLLSPLRSGMIICRADLYRAGKDLEVGLRIGERRFILQALLNQDLALALRWLANEADTWIKRQQDLVEDLGSIATFWANRATLAKESLTKYAEIAEQSPID